MRQIAVRLDDELAEAVDRARGECPRERWIRHAIGLRLTRETSAETFSTPKSTQAKQKRLPRPKTKIGRPPPQDYIIERAVSRAEAFRRAAQLRQENSKPPQNSPRIYG